jgi:hypothetical protein
MSFRNCQPVGLVPVSIPSRAKLDAKRSRIDSGFERPANSHSQLPPNVTCHPQLLCSGMKVAENLLMLSLGAPQDRLLPQLEYTLTAGVLIDLKSVGRIELEETGSLRISNPTPTDSPPHDLVLSRIAELEPELLPSALMPRLGSRTSKSLLMDAHDRGIVSERTAHFLGVKTHAWYFVTDQAHIAGIREELRRVYDGTSTDPIATAVLLLCAAAALPKLLPNRPKPKSLRRRAEELPSSAIADELRRALRAQAIVIVGE